VEKSTNFKSMLLAAVFFLLIVLPIAVVILKEKIFHPKEVQIISRDTSKVNK